MKSISYGTQTRAGLSHRPEIDGLRAVAVLPVILFHARIAPFSGGFVGVDVFFVISGFLITSIIIDTLERGQFSFLEFYSRRVRRILPALILVVLVTLPVAWFLMLPEQFKEFAESICAVAIFASNFLFWMKSGYFAAAAETEPLLHTWSLAVEEQYYIFFPVVMLVLWRLRRPFMPPIVIGAILVVSFALSQWASKTFPQADFYLAPTRAWELMIGSLTAFWTHRFGQRASEMGTFGLAMIVVSVFAYNADTPFPSVFSLLPTVGTALVLVYADGTTVSGRLLSMRWPAGIGLISYSAYLWHQPIFALARIWWVGQPTAPIMLALSAASLCLAYLSWRFVEQPFRTIRLPQQRVVSIGAAASTALLALGVVLIVSGVQRRAFLSLLSPTRVATLHRIEQVWNKSFVPIDDGACQFDATPTLTVAEDARVAACAERLGPGVAVLGDSHARNLQRALATTSEAPAFMVTVDKDADCTPFVHPACLSGRAVDFLIRHRTHLRAVLFEEAGFVLLLDALGRPSGRLIFENREGPVATVNRQGIASVAAYLDGLQSRLHLPVIWIGPWLEPHIPMEDLLEFDCDAAARYMKIDPKKLEIFSNLDSEIDAGSKGHRFQYISAMRTIGFDARYDVFDCSQIYWMDGDHFSIAGERRFGARLAPSITRALAGTPSQ